MPTSGRRDPAGSSPAVAVLRRWQDGGGLVRVLACGATVTVALLTCTEEEVERCSWPADPGLLAFLAAEAGSDP